MLLSKVFSHLLIYFFDNFLLLLIRNRLILLVPVGESEEYGGYWLYILPLLELIILPELIITQGPSKHHSRLWKLTPKTLILVRVIMPLVLVEPEVL